MVKRQPESMDDTMTGKDLSIIIPTHNAGETINQLLADILSIQELELEVLLVDDCSTDGTREALGEWAAREDRIKVWLHDSNLGAGVARNTAFPSAVGRYSLFFDDDDQIHPETVVETVRAMDRGGQDLALLKYNYLRDSETSHAPMTNEDEGIWARQVGTSGAKQVTLDQVPELLNLTNYPWDRVFRTATYQECGLRFGSTMVNNDILGHWYSLLFADSILMLNAVVCTHIVLPGGSNLTNRSSRDRLSLFDAFIETHEMLRQHQGMQLKCCEYFWGSVLRVSSWAASRITDDVRPDFNARLRDLLLKISITEFNLVKKRNPVLAKQIVQKGIG